MATVANKARVESLDNPWCSQNRTNAGDPNGSLTPSYVGELVLDTTNKKMWQAQTSANTGWVTYNVGPRLA